MELTSEQQVTVTQWVQAGDDLSAIQKRLKEELGISMTYMDVRFLVDDLNLALLDKESKPDPAEKKIQEELDAKRGGGGAATGSVTVDVDNVVQPGALISGSVTFSDGERAQWMIDQMGRPSVVPTTEGYRPSEEDVHTFQTELSRVIQEKGF